MYILQDDFRRSNFTFETHLTIALFIYQLGATKLSMHHTLPKDAGLRYLYGDQVFNEIHDGNAQPIIFMTLKIDYFVCLEKKCDDNRFTSDARALWSTPRNAFKKWTVFFVLENQLISV